MVIEVSAEKNSYSRFFDLIFKKQATKILLNLSTASDRPKYVRYLSKKSDCEYSHTYRILQNLQELGLARSVKSGRKRLYNITNKGLIIAKNISEILSEYDKK